MGILTALLALAALGVVQNAKCDGIFPRGAVVSVTRWEKLPKITRFSNNVAARRGALPSRLKRADDLRENGEVRIPIPGPIPIDTEELKKIAEILSAIGQQVIPVLLGQKKEMVASELGKYRIIPEIMDGETR